MAVYGPVCHPQNTIWTSASLRFGPYNILWVTSRSINRHMALSTMNYLLNIMEILNSNSQLNQVFHISIILIF
jgi:alpha-amylase/alpha-mannosidase (GH57 family)